MPEVYRVTAAASIQRMQPDFGGTRRRCGLKFSRLPTYLADPPKAVLDDAGLRAEPSSREEAERREHPVTRVARCYYSLAELGFESTEVARATHSTLQKVAAELGVNAKQKTQALRSAIVKAAITAEIDAVRRAGALLSQPEDEKDE